VRRQLAHFRRYQVMVLLRAAREARTLAEERYVDGRGALFPEGLADAQCRRDVSGALCHPA